MWVLGQTGALGIKRSCNGHGDVTAVSTGPPAVMDLGIKRPRLLGGPVERTAHRPRFGASPSLLCSSVTRKRPKCFRAGCFFWVPDMELTDNFVYGSRVGIGNFKMKFNLNFRVKIRLKFQ